MTAGSADEEVQSRVAAFVASQDFSTLDEIDYLRARYDAGLAWIHFPTGYGGLDMPRNLQPRVESLLVDAGASRPDPARNPIGLSLAAPTILAHGSDSQKQRFLRPMWTGEEVWCQLFSEPGAGSDLAGLATRAVRDGDGWIVNGQKVWTSGAHVANFAIMLARTDPSVPKHQGLSYFLCDMSDPGVEVRPLRQITGEAEFNEVFLTDVRVPDSCRLGGVGTGWKVANSTLNNERATIGKPTPRGSGLVEQVSRTWRENPELRSPELQSRLLSLCVEAEVLRLTGLRLRQKAAAGLPGPEGAAIKVAVARLNQQLTGLQLELLGPQGLRYPDWAMVRPDRMGLEGRDAAFQYLRAKAGSIEGGTSEVLLNMVAERILGLPREQRADIDVAWKDLPK